MKYSKDYMDRLKSILSLAYRSKATTIEPSDNRWRQNVLRSVRQIGPIKQDAVHRMGFSQLTWRLAPVALTLMIILGVMIFRVEDTVEYQLAGLMVSDPVETYVVYEPLYRE
jgi:hypothetical protein